MRGPGHLRSMREDGIDAYELDPVVSVRRFEELESRRMLRALR